MKGINENKTSAGFKQRDYGERNHGHYGKCKGNGRWKTEQESDLPQLGFEDSTDE